MYCLPLSPGHARPEADAEGAAEELDARVEDAEGEDDVTRTDKELAAALLDGGAAGLDDEKLLDELGDGLSVELDDGRAELEAAAVGLEDDAREGAGGEAELEDGAGAGAEPDRALLELEAAGGEAQELT